MKNGEMDEEQKDQTVGDDRRKIKEKQKNLKGWDTVVSLHNGGKICGGK